MMKNPNHGIQLHIQEIELLHYKGFGFKLPASDSEGLSVHLKVDYYNLKTNEIYYMVWGEFENGVMLLLHENKIPMSDKYEIDQYIIADFNCDSAFRKSLKSTIEFFCNDENNGSDE